MLMYLIRNLALELGTSENGEIISGNNQENAAYPSGLCAERTTVFFVNANYPDCNLTGIAIAALQRKIYKRGDHPAAHADRYYSKWKIASICL